MLMQFGELVLTANHFASGDKAKAVGLPATSTAEPQALN
jgi:hypothetical protein